MRFIPTIGGPKHSHDFHDSSMMAFEYLPMEGEVKTILHTPSTHGSYNFWQIRMTGVMSIELECIGTGAPNFRKVPPEIYDVYMLDKGKQKERWELRRSQMGFGNPTVQVIVLASSSLRGHGSTDDLQGVRIVCIDHEISRAKNYSADAYPRPRIPAGEEEDS